MPSPVVETVGAAIVAIGDFNPSIVQPAWLAQNELLAPAEADAAEAELVRREFGRVHLSWAIVQVTRDRLEIASTEQTGQPDVLRDLAVGILQLLPHTPVGRLGLTNWVHVQMPNEESWHDLGHKLLPPSNWDDVLVQPGMLSADVRGVRTDDREGAINVTVQPSSMVPQGVFISVNDDFVLGDSASALDAVDVITASWDESQDRASQIRDHVLGLV
jgi:hypothetical protein